MTPARRRYVPLIVAAAGLAAYANAFSGPFIFDDDFWINPARLGSFPTALRDSRPVVMFSLWLNYQMDGLRTIGYHAFNIAVHLCSALLLFGIARRTLLSDRLKGRFGSRADGLALAVAGVWVVHPLLTQSVNFIVQRAELLMGLFYLLTLYCVIRGAGSGRPTRWYAGAIFSCVLGMGSKAVMVTAPLVVLLYDRIFLGRSWRELKEKRRTLYTGLSACWGLLGAFVALTPEGFAPSAGFALKGITPLEYAATQPGIILHYLRLAFWPHPLCLDYYWPVARSAAQALPPAAAVGALLAATLWALRRRPELGFLGAWFFLILAPTSSFFPLKDLLFEHRMYLPLAAVVASAVFAAWRLLEGHPRFCAAALAAVMMLLGTVTHLRNRDYQSDLTLWADTAAKQPLCARAQNVLGLMLLRRGDAGRAAEQFQKAVRLNPKDENARNNLGLMFYRQRRYDEAIEQFQEIIRLAPHEPGPYSNIGLVFAQQGKWEEAVAMYRRALKQDPAHAKAHNNLGLALFQLERYEEACFHLRQAVRVDPAYADAYNALGLVEAARDRFDEAADCFRTVIRLEPGNATAYANLAHLLARQRRWDEAIEQLRRAVDIDPGNPAVRQNLEDMLALKKQSEQVR